MPETRGRAGNRPGAWVWALRACLKNRPGKGLRARRGGWRGARREHIREKSVTDEQRSHPPRPAARPTGIFLKHALKLVSKVLIPAGFPVLFFCPHVSAHPLLAT